MLAKIASRTSRGVERVTSDGEIGNACAGTVIESAINAEVKSLRSMVSMGYMLLTATITYPQCKLKDLMHHFTKGLGLGKVDVNT